MKYIIGNWKANKNLQETQSWITAFKNNDLHRIKDQATIIICPPFPFIPHVKEAFEEFDHVHIGAQDISFYEAGQYTGEVASRSLEGLVEYVLIGHSERRSHYKETNATVDQKVHNAIGAKIEPIVCVRGIEDIIPDKVAFVAYEPVHAIGTGEYESVENVLKMKAKLQLKENQKFIYGGSVNEKNVADYLSRDEIDGVLPGGASLNPDTFYKLAR